ncbi:aminotransferase class I/II-fold pyridoxal phosphate-dependent enzyme [Pseudogulbenkiania ferrooxidans]|uniref:Putative 8-amino-7-oxononanoate synthase n=1 Tax=Pseudogulbenkiania ferrooxidans 2002 TaxID=279714 RepID=B9Z7N0_9NEIS|nr:aminotransferase class I/II-fold pyridoxal phosphate-dependent enzyme [Pseudogulbenkiania ferrooxidans]EEG07166.1 aminotransferase class I and II [Pseudogulbenkiania ferrooxidans 2002]
MTRFARHLAHHPIVNPFPGIMKLEAALGHPIRARIGSNESMPQPASPLLQLLGAAGAELARLYPDPYAHALRTRAAALNGVTADEVLFDTGADSLILLTLRLFCNVGDTVVSTAGTYPTLRYFAEGVGAQVVEVDYARGDGLLAPDLAALAEAAQRQRAALVYLANPDNPSGHYHRADAIARLRAALPADCVLLLDEAYLDFCVDEDDAPPAGVLPNTVRLRTLSKAYALAGLRVGYAIAAAEIVAKADQIRPQYALSAVAQAAAQAVLDEPDYARRLIADTLALRARLAEALCARGLSVLPSRTNFVAIAYPDAAVAERIQRALLADGVAVHRPPHAAMKHLLRVTAHPQALDAAVLDALAGSA